MVHSNVQLDDTQLSTALWRRSASPEFCWPRPRPRRTPLMLRAVLADFGSRSVLPRRGGAGIGVFSFKERRPRRDSIRATNGRFVAPPLLHLYVVWSSPQIEAFRVLRSRVRSVRFLLLPLPPTWWWWDGRDCTTRRVDDRSPAAAGQQLLRSRGSGRTRFSRRARQLRHGRLWGRAAVSRELLAQPTN
jgi:hypothetical protein